MRGSTADWTADLQIEFPREEALVLFAWLAWFNKTDRPDFEDPAAQRVLWNLEAVLEKVLVEPFDPA